MRFVAWWLASNTGIACAGVVGTMLAAVIEVAASKGAKRRGFIVQAPSVRGWESQARRRWHREIPPSRRPPRAGHARQERRRRNHARHARQTFRRSASASRNRSSEEQPSRRDRSQARKERTSAVGGTS